MHIKNSISSLQKLRAFILFHLEIVAMSFLTISFVLFFLKLGDDVIKNELLPIDLTILQFFYSLRSPLLNEVMILITNLGGKIMIGFGICVVIFFLLKRRVREAFLFAIIVGGSGIINAVLKNIFQRIRPQFYPLVIEKDYSFPSGHAMDSFVFYITLSYFIFYFIKNKKISVLAMLLSIILISLIGMSRIYLGVHYPTDVLGGYIAGSIMLLCILLIQKIILLKIRKTTR